MTQIILLEGIDGSGKSTVIECLKTLAEKGGYANVSILRDPGSSVFSEKIRSICADKDITAEPLSLTLAFMAARTELARYMQESTADLILLDRYWPSTIAYQCFGSGVPRSIVLQHVGLLDELYRGARIPRRTRFCLQIDPLLAHERRMADKGRTGERFKAADMEFKLRVADGYEFLCDNGDLRPIEVKPDMPAEAVARQVWIDFGGTYAD